MFKTKDLFDMYMTFVKIAKKNEAEFQQIGEAMMTILIDNEDEFRRMFEKLDKRINADYDED